MTPFLYGFASGLFRLVETVGRMGGVLVGGAISAMVEGFGYVGSGDHSAVWPAFELQPL